MFNVSEVLKGKKRYQNIKEDIDIEKPLLDNTDIRELKTVFISGKFEKIADDTYELDLDFNGEMILPCALTLEDVKVKFQNYLSVSLNEEDMFDFDFDSLLMSYIVLEIPPRVESESASLKEKSGKNWSYETEDEVKLDPRLQKLQDLLK